MTKYDNIQIGVSIVTLLIALGLCFTRRKRPTYVTEDQVATSAFVTDTVQRRGVVTRIGHCVFWRGDSEEVSGYAFMLEGSNEPFHTDATEVMALTRPGDEIQFEAELMPAPVEEGHLTPARRYAFEVTNLNLTLSNYEGRAA